jgi:putative hydrolase of the HAD superfamily
MPIRALVFDADGVVVQPPFRFMAYLERAHSLTPEHTRPFFHGSFRDCLVGRADLQLALLPFLADWGWSHDVDAFLQVWFDEENTVEPGLMATIDELRRRGLRCALATNQERHRLAYMRTRMGFATYFDAVFGSAEVGSVKLEPAFYCHVEQALGLTGAELLFWDDSAANVAQARASGWHAELYQDLTGFHRRLDGYLAVW